MKNLIEQIFSINKHKEFEDLCLEVFRHQVDNCTVYEKYISYLRIVPEKIVKWTEIPYLPIGFFKTHNVISSTDKPEIVFSSSGTTGIVQSKHLVTDPEVYRKSFNLAFEKFYGKVSDACLLALLPSYLEREGSSLIYMVDELIRQSHHPDSGYFLHNHDELHYTLNKLKSTGQKTILIGVTYALLDFIEAHQLDFPDLVVMETGGMKGKRREMVREELHELLKRGFGVDSIHSEYGMTELLSQAYSAGSGVFACPPWMRITLRDTNDPLSALTTDRTGGINVIDLANINSCSFIATQDLGRLHNNGDFEVLGRFDNSDIRGCNLLVG
ncbi:MAG: acyl transferase [Sphingobacteriales bacterium]|nr:MAG: acyl transferase [Sphingobacteriales bacterium]